MSKQLLYDSLTATINWVKFLWDSWVADSKGIWKVFLRLKAASFIPNTESCKTKEFAKWVKYIETSRLQIQYVIALIGEQQQVETNANPFMEKKTERY